ncbi:MAG TPA: hypothetical protein VMR76_01935 [Candidatus Saccharimonadia bacterium]|nr:hypothetical protein [Candidatus Saccharimonadia bacterium]
MSPLQKDQDIYGILSIILAVFLPPAGLIIGIIGIRKSKTRK